MYTCSNPKIESKDYNKKNTNVDGDDGEAAIGVRDDAQSSLDSDGGEDRCPSASSPSRSLPGVRFLPFWCLRMSDL
jgi:hypothetical protein